MSDTIDISPQGYHYGEKPLSTHPFWSGELPEDLDIDMSATVDDTTGTPAVTVIKDRSDQHYDFEFNFSGLKGEQGATGAQGPRGETGATPRVAAAATIDNTTGTANVDVETTGSDENPTFIFDFTGIKGEPGVNGVTPVITATASTDDQTLGIPYVTVTKTGTDVTPNFDFAFHGLKGDVGNSMRNAYISLETDSGDPEPYAEVTKSLVTGTNMYDLRFRFYNLTGPQGPAGHTPVVSATATVDGGTGTPGVTVINNGTTEDPSFRFAFTNLKGADGANGADGITPTITATASVTDAGELGVTVTKTGTDAAPNFNFAFTGFKKGGGGVRLLGYSNVVVAAGTTETIFLSDIYGRDGNIFWDDDYTILTVYPSSGSVAGRYTYSYRLEEGTGRLLDISITNHYTSSITLYLMIHDISEAKVIYDATYTSSTAASTIGYGNNTVQLTSGYGDNPYYLYSFGLSPTQCVTFTDSTFPAGVEFRLARNYGQFYVANTNAAATVMAGSVRIKWYM